MVTRLLDLADHLRIGHPGHSALGADVGRDALERHHRAGARLLGDPRLLGVDDVHDDAALEHLREPALDPHGAVLSHVVSVSSRAVLTVARPARWAATWQRLLYLRSWPVVSTRRLTSPAARTRPEGADGVSR